MALGGYDGLWVATARGSDTAGLAPGRREGLLGSRYCWVSVVGYPRASGDQFGAGGPTALRGASGRAGPIALVPTACQRLAPRAERTGAHSARGASSPEDSTRGRGAAGHR